MSGETVRVFIIVKLTIEFFTFNVQGRKTNAGILFYIWLIMDKYGSLSKFCSSFRVP